MQVVEFFYDIASPYSYLASTRIDQVVVEAGAKVQWRPFLIGGVFKATGNQPPASLPAKRKYMLRDLKLWASYYKVPFHFPVHFPVNTLLAMRILTALPEAECKTMSHKLFQAYWVNGLDISNADILESIVGPENLALASQDKVKEQLKQTTENAVQRGAFGAPTMFVNDTMFFGNDRLSLLGHYLQHPEDLNG
ncbi:MAG: 2-hydroxychromene-2-carboxylate isomerase [SAR324 cluster bacterium]|nr:2-hydroxychromene-2-carboxylate isomerase [SAR324 cluster bacterium]